MRPPGLLLTPSDVLELALTCTSLHHVIDDTNYWRHQCRGYQPIETSGFQGEYQLGDKGECQLGDTAGECWKEVYRTKIRTTISLLGEWWAGYTSNHVIFTKWGQVNCINRPDQQILIPDWLVTSHVT